jgi:hypothetical protein
MIFLKMICVKYPHFFKHQEKLLSLWKDADPGIAEIEGASQRLAGLKGL